MKKGLFSLVLCAIATPATHAVVIDMEGFTGAYKPNCTGGPCTVGGTTYTEDGYTLTARNIFAAWRPGNINYTGSTALFDASFTDSQFFEMTNGVGVFTVLSIDFAEIYKDSGSKTWDVVGTFADSTTVRQKITLDGTPGFETFKLLGFTDVVKVSWEGSYGSQYDNIRIADVPEPSTLALMTIGLAGIGSVGRRKGAA